MVSILMETEVEDLGFCPSLLCFLSQGLLVQNIPGMSLSSNVPSGTQHTLKKKKKVFLTPFSLWTNISLCFLS